MAARERAKLTNQIRRFRFEHDEMTQQMLASHVGVTRQTIIALESGKYSPSRYGSPEYLMSPLRRYFN